MEPLALWWLSRIWLLRFVGKIPSLINTRQIGMQRIGIGVIIRDHRGLVFTAQSKTIRAAYDPTTAEAVAALYAIELSRDTGLKPEEGAARRGFEDSDFGTQWARSQLVSFYGQVIDDAKAVLNTFHG
jgi:hypothetical protein